MNFKNDRYKTLVLPPRIKILEALGAIADERIRVLDEKNAEVVSSDGSRKYHVYVDINNGIVSSNDNGTRYRGYIGYPIIAFLMLKKMLPFDKDIAEALKGIQWKKLNEKYKRYFIVEKIVKSKAMKQGISPRYIDDFIAQVISELKKFEFKMKEEKTDITSYF